MRLKDIWFNICFETRWHFKHNWLVYVAAVVILSGVALIWHASGRLMDAQTRPPAVVTTVAEGTIISVRATGSFSSWCRIELKFDDGTVLLTSYQFIRRYKIKEGRRYIIKDHSRIGRIAVPL